MRNQMKTLALIGLLAMAGCSNQIEWSHEKIDHDPDGVYRFYEYSDGSSVGVFTDNEGRVFVIFKNAGKKYGQLLQEKGTYDAK